MERLHSAAERISLIAVYAGGTLIFVSALLVTFEVVARKLFGFSLGGADELSGYAYGLSMAWGYAYVLFHRGHLRIDVVYLRFPRAVRCALDVISLAAFTGLMGHMTYRAWGVLARSITLGAKANTPLSTPLWIPQSVWFLGLAFFLLCLGFLLLRSIAALLAGDRALVEEIAGARAVSVDGPRPFEERT